MTSSTKAFRLFVHPRPPNLYAKHTFCFHNSLMTLMREFQHSLLQLFGNDDASSRSSKLPWLHNSCRTGKYSLHEQFDQSSVWIHCRSSTSSVSFFEAMSISSGRKAGIVLLPTSSATYSYSSPWSRFTYKFSLDSTPATYLITVLSTVRHCLYAGVHRDGNAWERSSQIFFLFVLKCV